MMHLHKSKHKFNNNKYQLVRFNKRILKFHLQYKYEIKNLGSFSKYKPR